MLQKTSTAVALALMLIAESASAGQAESAGVCDLKAKPAKLNFTLKDVNNKPVTLSDFKCKVLVLNFWATWCIPCRAEIPALVDLQTKYAGNGLQVIGVSVDDPVEKMKPFIGQYKINYPVLTAFKNDAILNSYGPMVVVPATVLIERDGKVCTKHIGPVIKENFEREIKGLL